MKNTKEHIVERLEKAFAENGFAHMGIADLRKIANVSLRTLYKYYPSKEIMIIEALKYRHLRYLAYLFDDMSEQVEERIDQIFDRIDEWMRKNAPQGCIFQNALAAQPNNSKLYELLLLHKEDIGKQLASALHIEGQEAIMKQIHESAIHSWIFQQKEAAEVAKKLTKYIVRECCSDE